MDDNDLIEAANRRDEAQLWLEITLGINRDNHQPSLRSWEEISEEISKRRQQI